MNRASTPCERARSQRCTITSNAWKRINASPTGISPSAVFMGRMMNSSSPARADMAAACLAHWVASCWRDPSKRGTSRPWRAAKSRWPAITWSSRSSASQPSHGVAASQSRTSRTTAVNGSAAAFQRASTSVAGMDMVLSSGSRGSRGRGGRRRRRARLLRAADGLGAGRVQDGPGVEELLQHGPLARDGRGEADAVHVDARAAVVAGLELAPRLGGAVHEEEGAVAELAEVAVPLVVLRVLAGAGDVRAERVDEHVRGAEDRLDLLVPVPHVELELLHGQLRHRPVAPRVGGELPAAVLERVGDLGGGRDVGVERGAVPELAGRGAVAEHAVVAGHGQHAAGAVEAEVRVLGEEVVQARDDVERPDVRGALGVRVLVADAAVLGHDQAVREAVAVHVEVVRAVVQGEDQRGPALGDHEGLRAHDVVLPHLVQLVRGDQHVTALVDLPDDGVELVHRDHEVQIAAGLVVAVEGAGRVHHEGVEEQVRNPGHVRPGHRVAGGRRTSGGGGGGRGRGRHGRRRRVLPVLPAGGQQSRSEQGGTGQEHLSAGRLRHGRGHRAPFSGGTHHPKAARPGTTPAGRAGGGGNRPGMGGRPAAGLDPP
ncbi:hypothetical protein MICRO80W_730010 [Micrococcus luteus]|nr:hypothetical protein MICRO80W_730010 [Micrococcus luteus]